MSLVSRLHQRLVDIEGDIALHTNRYSVPVDWIGRRVEVHFRASSRQPSLQYRWRLPRIKMLLSPFE